MLGASFGIFLLSFRQRLDRSDRSAEDYDVGDHAHLGDDHVRLGDEHAYLGDDHARLGDEHAYLGDDHQDDHAHHQDDLGDDFAPNIL